MKNLAVVIFVALATMLSVGEVEAIPISFTATGTFSSPTGGCTAAAANTITCDGYLLTYSSVPTVVDVPLGFDSVVNFGQVAVTGTGSATMVNGGGSFALQIAQTGPAPTAGSPFTYTAALSVSLINNASGSFLQFNAPLTRIVNSATTDVTYLLTEADDVTPGRSRIAGLNQPALDMNGTVTPKAVNTPEPSSLLLLGSGILGLTAVGRRKKNVSE